MSLFMKFIIFITRIFTLFSEQNFTSDSSINIPWVNFEFWIELRKWNFDSKFSSNEMSNFGVEPAWKTSWKRFEWIIMIRHISIQRSMRSILNFNVRPFIFIKTPLWKPFGAIQYRKLKMKLIFFILEVVLAQKEMSIEEAKNWKQPTYWEAMTQVGFQSCIN